MLTMPTADRAVSGESIGTIKLTEDNEVIREGGVKYTLKDGIIYDSKALLKEVKDMVAAEKAKTGYKILQPEVKE